MTEEIKRKRKQTATLRWLQIDPTRRIEYPTAIDMGCNIFWVAQELIDGQWINVKVEQE